MLTVPGPVNLDFRNGKNGEIFEACFEAWGVLYFFSNMTHSSQKGEKIYGYREK